MTTDESEAIDAFEHLGLTSYEAKVFIALQRLGSGTARDVARTTDVPRSQVYSVAESLAEHGLLDVQQASPIRYRPVNIEDARTILRDRFEHEQDRAFEFVDQVSEEVADEETQEDIWTVRGRDRIDDRTVDLLSSADERLVFATRLPELFTDAIGHVLEEQARAGVETIAVSRTETVCDRFAELEGVSVESPTRPHTDDHRSGRIAIVDDDGILLSVVDDAGEETAIWSSESLFATVLIQLIEANQHVR